MVNKTRKGKNNFKETKNWNFFAGERVPSMELKF